MSRPHVVILGAGPAGLGAAHQLATLGRADVTVLERNTAVGGNAGSFELAGLRVDYGSHRLHPACDPRILEDIRGLLGDDLLDRPRHGRIRLRGRWIHFPLKPLDLALRLPPDFALGVAADSTKKVLRTSRNGRGSHGEESFASVLRTGLGETICRDFYFPYARKIWGVEPQTLSSIQAHRRVSAGSLTKMVRKVASAVPGLKPKGAGRFFYPRRGYGQISEAYAESAVAAGAVMHLGASVKSVSLGHPGQPRSVVFEQAGRCHALTADYVWSTIPVTTLANIMEPAPPAETLRAAQRIDFRAMILIYLVVEQQQFTEYDAHYFPDAAVRITRLSEPKNYSATREPIGRTVLCAELPCSPDDAEWSMRDAELGEVVKQSLEVAGIPVRAPVSNVVTRRLRQAYPIYSAGYEQHLSRLDEWMSRQPGVLTFGRQGLFAHDNTHHALYMAYSAVDCLESTGQFNHQKWQAYRRIFETHVVED